MRKRRCLYLLIFLASCSGGEPTSAVLKNDPSLSKKTLTDFNGKTVLRSVLESDSAFSFKDKKGLVGSLNADCRINQDGNDLSLFIYVGANYESQDSFKRDYKDIGTLYNLKLGYSFVTDETNKFINDIIVNDLCLKPQDSFLDFYKFIPNETESNEGKEAIYSSDMAVYHSKAFEKKIALKDYADYFLFNPQGWLCFDFYLETVLDNGKLDLSNAFDSRYRKTSIRYQYENGKLSFEEPRYHVDGLMK